MDHEASWGKYCIIITVFYIGFFFNSWLYNSQNSVLKGHNFNNSRLVQKKFFFSNTSCMHNSRKSITQKLNFYNSKI